MSISNQPKNQNLLLETNFKFQLNRISNVSYFCQSVILPGLRINNIKYDTPLSPIAIAGNVAFYNPLKLTFLVDEDLLNWLELRKWMLGIGKPNSHEQAKLFNSYKEGLSDALLEVTTNAKNPYMTVKFQDCYPISVSDIQFNSATQFTNNILCQVDFAYTTYLVEVHNKVLPVVSPNNMKQ